MSDLGKRLEAAGRREAEKLYPCGHDFKVRLSGLSSCGLCLSSLSDNKARSHLYPLIQKMAEALEECHAINMRQYGSIDAVKNAAHITPGGIQALLIDRALADLEKYLGGV